MTIPGLVLSETDGVLTLRFDRPEVFNALSDEMVIGVSETLEKVNSRDDVRVVVLTGTGAAFSTGADVGGENAHERFDVRAMDAANRLIRAIVQCHKPVIAGVNGIAAGVGLSAALACDLAVTTESASLLLAFARVGLMPDGGASATVAAAIGRPRAMRMALLAEPLSAAEAYRVGLVSHLVADADYEAELASVIKRIRYGAPLAQTATKRAINQASLAALEPTLEYERDTQTMLLRTADVAEGMAAFSEKRRAVFQGE